MEIKLLTPGKTKSPWLQEGISHFEQRLKPFCRLEWDLVKPSRQQNPELAQQEESQSLAARMKPGYVWVVFDERGDELSSQEFARFLQTRQDRGETPLGLVLGGAHGLTPEIRAQAAWLLRLSRMTLTHEMARLLLLEQVYRGFSILKKTGYHH